VVQTPVGRVTVTAEADNVVVVHLDPTSPHTLVVGLPFTLPALPATLPGYNRTTLNTTEGVVTIDSLQPSAGFPARFATTSTTGSTVTFTPVALTSPASDAS
jgi:hypothetical protein